MQFAIFNLRFPGWDALAVWLIIAAAALYLLRGARARKKSGCGGCSACPGESAGSPPSALVQIEPRRGD